MNKEENFTLLTCCLIKEKLNNVISPQDISVVNRLGEKNGSQAPIYGGGPFGRRRLGTTDWAPDNWVPCRLGAEHLGVLG